MKRLTTLLVLVPGSAFAHGGHAQLSGTAHDGFHAAPLVGAGVILAALALAALRGRG